MKKLLLPAVAATALLVTSCMKDELPNAECDIRKATVHLPKPENYFVNLSDTNATVLGDYASNIITFKGVKTTAKLEKITPTFTISKGAVLYPPQGTQRDFSYDATKNEYKRQTYFVIAEDTKDRFTFPKENDEATIEAYLKTLEEAAKFHVMDKLHMRAYEVFFTSYVVEMADVVEYNFNDYKLEKNGRYYEWNDLFEGHERPIANWATANQGYSVAKSSAKPMEYPTIPMADGGQDGGPYVKLTTLSTGPWGESTKKPLAAGNLFLGAFDFSKALGETMKSTRFGDNSILGRKPVRFTGYYQFAPGAEYKTYDEKSGISTPQPSIEDRPAIYCIIYLNKDQEGKPYVLDGNTVDDPANPQRIAKAEITQWVTTKQHQGWIPFDLGFQWFQPFNEDILKANGYNFAIVCSSSKDGASYSGAIGSTLLVDNFKLIMDK